MTHVADIIFLGDPDGSPSIQSFKPGQAREPWLVHCVTILGAVLGEDEVSEAIPALAGKFDNETVARCVADDPDGIEKIVDELNESAISNFLEPRLPEIFAVEV